MSGVTFHYHKATSHQKVNPQSQSHYINDILRLRIFKIKNKQLSGTTSFPRSSFVLPTFARPALPRPTWIYTHSPTIA